MRRKLVALSLILRFSLAVNLLTGVLMARVADGAESGSSYYRSEEHRPLPPGTVFRDCPDCPEMVVVPAGSFLMGSPSNELGRKDDEVQHLVTIRSAFAIGKYDVTLAEWDACLADGGCEGNRPSDNGKGAGRRPVIQVSWFDAKSYAAWLSRKTGNEYRLPSEAEWEYAARGGTTTPFWWGKAITPDQANYDGTFAYNNGSKGVNRNKILDVGSYKPNPFGLYDTSGNVWQWVEDIYHQNYLDCPKDGTPCIIEDGDSFRVVRGGSWFCDPNKLRSADRNFDQPDNPSDGYGFRVVKVITHFP